MAAASPATAALAANTAELSNLAVQVGDTSRLLARFPSIAGTDTSGRSIIRDLNTIAGAANDVAVSPDTSWLALNRLIPPLVKSTSGSAISVHVGVDQADPRIDSRHRIPWRHRVARTTPLQREPAGRHPEVHPVASAGTRGRPRAELAAGSRHPRPQRPGPNRRRARPSWRPRRGRRHRDRRHDRRSRRTSWSGRCGPLTANRSGCRWPDWC